MPAAKQTANVFSEIQVQCKIMFGFTPNIMQMRFWYFGGRKLTDERRKHREHVVKTVAEWDVVIKLALRYTSTAIGKSGRRWSDREIMKFVYYCLWSTYRMMETNAKNGKPTQMPTFWMFAVENRHNIKPHISGKAALALKEVFRRASENIK